MDETIRNRIDLKRPALPPGSMPVDTAVRTGPCVDFVDAILRPPTRVGIIDALNMTVPGYYAHLSAVKDGETMKIPQYTL